ncbi:MAG TPA: VWA domain-containing protein [Vicinamibacterales bacterium]|nr:VWA domain-containing protein [Vicinamibacterales bacterium]
MTPRLAGLGFTAAIVTAVSAQQPAPTFRAQVEAVQVDVFVTDRDGNPVRDLRLEDFELLEDGKPQTITSFSEVIIPINAPPPFSPGTPRLDVATNSGGEGRLYVIALDEVGADLALRARHFLTTFIERHFEPNDVGVVVNVGRALSAAAQDFTSDRGLLLAAINRLQGGWGVPPETPGEPWRRDRSPLAQRARAAALKGLIASLAGIHGRRKALIYITEEVGDVYSVIDYKGGVRSLEFDDLRAAMTEAMRGGVAFYTIDPCGLTAGGFLGETAANVAGVCDADLERMAAFRKLSEATGGFAVVNSNSFGQALERMVKENSNYYLLGFTSTNDRRDGRYRRLEVRAKRPGLTVRARDGYIAPSGSPGRSAGTRTNATATAGIRDVIASPLSNGAVPMKVFAAAFKGSKDNEARVVITAEFDASRLGFTGTSGIMRAQIELASAAVSAGGKVTRGQPQVIDLALKPDSYAQALAHGFRTQSSITLPPGRYQLRVAGGNTQAAKVGSVMYDLDVPDFRKERLALSAVALSTMEADRPVTVIPAASNVLPFFPTLNRAFASGTRISLYLEVYDNADGRARNPVELKVEVRDHQGQIVRSGSDRRTRAAKGTETFVVALPLDVGAGDYSLHVVATSGGDSVSRDIPIRITP